jgi:hypothetical protein
MPPFCDFVDSPNRLQALARFRYTILAQQVKSLCEKPGGKENAVITLTLPDREGSLKSVPSSGITIKAVKIQKFFPLSPFWVLDVLQSPIRLGK